jgi:N-acetylglutamate synthase-like GNAT family acetyltransferase
MAVNYEIKTVDAATVDETGFFCYMSKKKEPGYKQKREWLLDRFKEGMKIKILHEKGGRDTAFIEYIPGDFAWRAVNASGYMVIHCLWVVGKGKGKGYGRRLIEECVKDARAQGLQGVAMVTSDRVWLAGREIFLKNGFQEVDQAPPCFHLMVTRFGKGPEIGFPSDWEKRAKAFGPGLTVIRSPQCPYIENGANDLMTFAREKGIPARTVELKTARQVQEQSPSAYGVFGTVLDGKLLAYHYLLRRDFDRLLLERKGGEK